MTEQAAEKAGSARGLRGLLYLLHLLDLGARLVQRKILHQNGLGQFVNGVRIPGKPLLEQFFGFGIFLRQLCCLYLANQIFKHRAFLRCHDNSSYSRMLLPELLQCKTQVNPQKWRRPGTITARGSPSRRGCFELASV